MGMCCVPSRPIPSRPRPSPRPAAPRTHLGLSHGSSSSRVISRYNPKDGTEALRAVIRAAAAPLSQRLSRGIFCRDIVRRDPRCRDIRTPFRSAVALSRPAFRRRLLYPPGARRPRSSHWLRAWGAARGLVRGAGIPRGVRVGAGKPPPRNCPPPQSCHPSSTRSGNCGGCAAHWSRAMGTRGDVSVPLGVPRCVPGGAPCTQGVVPSPPAPPPDRAVSAPRVGRPLAAGAPPRQSSRTAGR